eukprot:11047751-Alexandrium_andersonii.AAC.1
MAIAFAVGGARDSSKSRTGVGPAELSGQGVGPAELWACRACGRSARAAFAFAQLKRPLVTQGESVTASARASMI